MTYELKRHYGFGGLQVLEQYTSKSGESFEVVALIATGSPVTLITSETYELLSDEEKKPLEKNFDIGIYYIPAIPNPKHGLIKNFTIGGKLWGDLQVLVCDCKIGYPNEIIIGADIIMKCRSFQVDGGMVIFEKSEE